MRDYFLLLDDERIINKTQPAGLGNNVKFEELPPVSVLPVEYSRTCEYVDWLGKPMRMASDRMKSLMEKYNRYIRFKRVELIDTKQSGQHSYWIMQVPAVECLSPQSEFHPGGTLKRLVLDREQVKGHHMFAIQGILEPYIVVSLDVAESLLRRHWTGFILQKIERA
ncbi:hypothetical protein AV654_15020 [Paenibacillus elgii]|uniref:Immunity MXAN-0049 protein domain-containing protein n=1 Tax=Paenibacillus elgii TaxID=189691 RepID=A0A165R875_9BACL|nr:DUF1629 domain-containing protein [Paenibacillus elgii]KZE79612.1 hypothetical protein AV654_15020 [Paenibacillus elgii]